LNRDGASSGIGSPGWWTRARQQHVVRLGMSGFGTQQSTGRPGARLVVVEADALGALSGTM
jgi:hypothetical protein